MNTSEIDEVLNKHPATRWFAVKTVASDILASSSVEQYPFIGVVNLDPSTEPGSHWVAFVVLGRDEVIEYFDSYGRDPDKRILHFLKRHSSREILWNKTVIQAFNSAVCGAHCLFFLIHRCIGYSMHEIINNLYCKDLTLNDCRAVLCVTPYVTSPVKSLCLNQTCSFKLE